MTRARKLRRAAAVLVTGLGVAATGCVTTGHPLHEAIAEERGGPITVPPPGAVPSELNKIQLPEYVIEPPDVLFLQVATRIPAKEALEEYEKERKERENQGKGPPPGPPPVGDQLRSLPLQAVQGDHTVRPDGTIYLGVYGSVPVAGYTLSQAAAAIRQAIAQRAGTEIGGIRPDRLVVVLDVAQYASKRYYVILDGGGAGQQVIPLPITGSETVLDALANVYGLPPVASQRNIWIARRCPEPGHPEQILPVDWVGITQHGITTTNYQVMPGDRIFVKAQRLVTIDTTLARIINPIERIFGITLLGTSTINQIQGRGTGFGGQ